MYHVGFLFILLLDLFYFVDTYNVLTTCPCTKFYTEFLSTFYYSRPGVFFTTPAEKFRNVVAVMMANFNRKLQYLTSKELDNAMHNYNNIFICSLTLKRYGVHILTKDDKVEEQLKIFPNPVMIRKHFSLVSSDEAYEEINQIFKLVPAVVYVSCAYYCHHYFHENFNIFRYRDLIPCQMQF
jgi:hypothetical protein